MSDDEVYIVDEIIGKKMMEDEKDVGKYKLHYRIKWKGYTEAYNSWEPIKNLRGCLELINAYEEGRTERRNRGLDSDPEADEEPSLSYLEHKEKTRQDLLECGVKSRWPRELIPLEMVGVVVIDKNLCYIVRHQTNNYVASLSAENTVIVRADTFRLSFPHIVIAFYEPCVLWVNRAESKEELEAKSLRALEISKLVENAENATRVEDDHMEEDELDEDGLPIPKLATKDRVDLYGLPLPFDDSGTSSSDDEFTVKPIPGPSYPVLSQRNE